MIENFQLNWFSLTVILKINSDRLRVRLCLTFEAKISVFKRG